MLALAPPHTKPGWKPKAARLIHLGEPQIQFHMRGPSGRATVSADMYQEGSEWRYNFLYVNVESPVPQQVSGATRRRYRSAPPLHP